MAQENFGKPQQALSQSQGFIFPRSLFSLPSLSDLPALPSKRMAFLIYWSPLVELPCTRVSGCLFWPCFAWNCWQANNTVNRSLVLQFSKTGWESAAAHRWEVNFASLNLRVDFQKVADFLTRNKCWGWNRSERPVTQSIWQADNAWTQTLTRSRGTIPSSIYLTKIQSGESGSVLGTLTSYHLGPTLTSF